MKEIKRDARVHWAGSLMSGRGQITTGSKALDGTMYSVPSRFEQESGTNPEELIAAAHAACFTMMLAKVIGDQKKSLEQIDTRATVLLRQDGAKFTIAEIHLQTQARVTGMNQEEFRKAAEEAKETCPVSALLKPGLENIRLEATLL
jgi:lipoyl-dependent peroxiredoxin